MAYLLLKQANFSKNLKRQSFLRLSYHSKLNYTFWLDNFLGNNCFNEQLPSSKRLPDKIYSENFLRLLINSSDSYHTINLYKLVQFKRNLVVKDTFAHLAWSDFVKVLQLNSERNLVSVISISFNLKKSSLVWTESLYLSFVSLIVSGAYKTKKLIYKAWLDSLILLTYNLPSSCFYYKTFSIKHLSLPTTPFILFYYWFLYNSIFYNKFLFYRKLIFNYSYYLKTVGKKQVPGPFLIPYSTIKISELVKFSNSISSIILNHLRFTSGLHSKLNLFFRFIFSIFIYNKTTLYFLSSPAVYQKMCYDYFLLNNNANSIEVVEHSLFSNTSSKFSLIFSSIYLNYIFVSYKFINKSISFFSDSFYFYFQKFTKYFLFRGNLLSAFSKVTLFFYRLMRLSLSQDPNSLTYFSDAFSSYLPSISITTKAVSKGNSRSIVVPKLLKVTKRIPKALQRFNFSIKRRKESTLVQRFFLEFTELLDMRGETLKSFMDTYKSAIVNLQFSQSLSRSFFFEYRSRVYPTTIGKVRRRVRLENQLNYF